MARTVSVEELRKDLFRTLAAKNMLVWDHRANRPIIDRWLDNFNGKFFPVEKERLMALYTVSKFVFVGQQEVNYLCRLVFDRYLNFRARSNAQRRSDSLSMRRRILDSTTFRHLGRDSESGELLLYYFRTANSIGQSHISNAEDKAGGKTICYIDDVSLTGSQAHAYAKHKAEHQFLLLMVATEEAITTLSSIGLTVIAPVVLRQEEIRLGVKSPLAIDLEAEVGGLFTMQELRTFLGQYGQLVYRGPGLGYRDQGLLLGFHYNTPDNTLPVLWSGRRWFPVFPRAPKRDETRLDESKPFF